MILIGGLSMNNKKEVSMETLETLTDLLERAEDYYHYNNFDDLVHRHIFFRSRKRIRA
jgi:hypothetical protein